MRRTAVVLALAGTLWPAAACAAPDRAAPGPAPSTSAPVRATLPVAPATASATPAPYDVIANMPAAAKEHSDKGAEAFARYFFQAANEVNQNPSAGNWIRLCSPDLRFCKNREENTQWLISNNYHISGQEHQVFVVDSVPGTSRGEVILVTVGVKQLATRVVDGSGKDIDKWTTPETVSVNLGLSWLSSGWSATSITTLH